MYAANESLEAVILSTHYRQLLSVQRINSE